MSYADEEEAITISWEEHSQIVRNTYLDGQKDGREPVMKLMRELYAKNQSEDLKKIIDKIDDIERDKNSIIVMRPGVDWITGLEKLCELLGREAKIVEIGCYSGESTEVFAKHLNSVFAIDPWRPVDGVPTSEDTHNYTHKIDIAEKVFDNRMAVYHNCFKLKGFDYEFLPMFPDGSLDAVYVDGNHYEEEVKKNILAWLPKVKEHGFFCGHDYYDVTPGVVKAVNEVFGEPDCKFEDSSWAVDLYKWNIRKNLIVCPGQ